MLDDPIALTRALLAFQTLNPPGDEEACAAFLAEQLIRHGYRCELQRFGERRFNLVAWLDGEGPGTPLGFTGHLDTVPLGNATWNHSPFAGEIVDGLLYGRGASDMKAGIAAFIVACQRSRAAIQRGPGVRLLLTGGEETGCDGARALCTDAPHLLGELGALLVGEPTANYPILGHKGALWLRCASHGLTAHGAMPEEGVNAIYLAARHIDRAQTFEVGPAHHLMRKPTLNVGTISGGLNINSVPDYAEFTLDLRTAPNLDHDEIRTRLAAHLGNGAELSTLIDLPGVCADPDEPWVRQVFARCQALHDAPLQAQTVPYFTDAAVLLPAVGHPPTLILGPGEPSMAHKVDEYCEVSKLQQCVELYAGLIEDWANIQSTAAAQHTTPTQ
ncbi:MULTISPECIES: M20 family metallopeptidase [Pseudomonas syringae group]|uniref:Peptidase M20:peptidase M20 n=2 Tax=Pseudomonas syringae group TaxID=136849 RepID=A0A0N8R3S0_PSESX|nr:MULTISPECIES: M20 family metallopeptidase [Pseudomonas syringae group]KPW90366.1 Peptidase M20:peptidase M20 [Pseudomonas syringae pv. cerasicola]KWS98015.1 peptidase M20 [Pseudomonas syringae pv. cerasicola]PHN69757.1 peptidase M20 [Pseudomonas syringae pv. cerasicola]PHN71425.1 peptidase M20 [Pseudomonas syringae pv. cerasicola]RMS66635.1 Peptidase M20:peptidase M20 [Pseudomonas savastanoi]